MDQQELSYQDLHCDSVYFFLTDTLFWDNDFNQDLILEELRVDGFNSVSGPKLLEYHAFWPGLVSSLIHEMSWFRLITMYPHMIDFVTCLSSLYQEL